MTILALSSSEQTLWIVLLVVGLVVLGVVVALLTVLLREVGKVDEGAKGVWNAAARLARNTATTWQLGQTAGALEAVKAEAIRHDELLDKVLS